MIIPPEEYDFYEEGYSDEFPAVVGGFLEDDEEDEWEDLEDEYGEYEKEERIHRKTKMKKDTDHNTPRREE